MGAGVGDRCSGSNCLTFLIITKETSTPLLLPWKPLHLHHGDSPLEGSSLSGEEVPAEGEERTCLQTLLCCPPGIIQEKPGPGNSHSAEECGDIPGAVQKHNVKARMSRKKHELEELFSEFISRAAFPLVRHYPDQRKYPNFHVSQMLEVCRPGPLFV